MPDMPAAFWGPAFGALSGVIGLLWHRGNALQDKVMAAHEARIEDNKESARREHEALMLMAELKEDYKAMAGGYRPSNAGGAQ